MSLILTERLALEADVPQKRIRTAAHKNLDRAVVARTSVPLPASPALVKDFIDTMLLEFDRDE